MPKSRKSSTTMENKKETITNAGEGSLRGNKEHEDDEGVDVDADQLQGNKKAAGTDAIRQRKGAKQISASTEKNVPTDVLSRPAINRSPSHKGPSHAGPYHDSGSGLESRESRKSRKGRGREEDQHGSTSSQCRSILLVVVVIVALIAIAWWFMYGFSGLDLLQETPKSSSVTEKCTPRKRSDRYDALMQRMTDLKKRFLSMNKMAWNVIGGSSMAHVTEDMNPDNPVVLLLVGHPGADTDVRILASQVADMYAGVFAVHHDASDIAYIEGARLAGQSADDAKLSLDEQLKSGLSGCSKVALVNDFDKVPPCSAILFHAYCDNDSAPYKDAVIILTMMLKEALGKTDFREKSTDEAIRSHLEKRWTKCPEEIPPDKTEAMLSRVANNVVIMK
ncbi:torsin-1A-interacting protein 1-like [Diadema setosum]|uniref:torsin-1A-interacting protein 1-like n=1 Tax=Diadema setosum TaxID=31175 RepID=UPI003B3AD430